MNKSTTLEFLIPSYKRPQTLIKSVNSLAEQVKKFGLEKRIKITVVDDFSPNINTTEILEEISQFSGFVTFRQNSVNKGMSLNIRDMVANSSAEFCTILTDDDFLQPNSLEEIVETLDSLSKNKEETIIGSFFVPRYSYLEDQSLHCIVCKPFNEDTMILSSPLNSVRYLHNGFILTGFFFRPKLINFQLWDQHIENSFFPVIYFADLILKYKCMFFNRNWFVHTVLNECHWDSWGDTEQARLSRLYKDYMKAVTISSKNALSKVVGFIPTIQLLKAEFCAYKFQINGFFPSLNKERRTVDDLTSNRAAYKLALFMFYLIDNSLINTKSQLRAWFFKIKKSIIQLKTYFYSIME